MKVISYSGEIIARKKKKKGDGNLETKAQFLAFALTGYMDLGKLLVLSKPQLPHL